MWTLLAPIIFQAVKAAELSIKGKRRGKQKKKFAEMISGTAFRFLQGIGDIKTIPLDDEVSARIELALSALRAGSEIPNPIGGAYNRNPPLASFVEDQKPDHTVTLTTGELIQIISAASGRTYP